jgi:hypothetical protein
MSLGLFEARERCVHSATAGAPNADLRAKSDLEKQKAVAGWPRVRNKSPWQEHVVV